MRKYGNKKVIIDGITFDSRKEARRFRELQLLERAGEIHGLELQRVFELIPAQTEEVLTGEVYKRGEKKGQQKTKVICVEKSVTYRADFCYYLKDGTFIVEDTKGIRTKDFIIKRKLMLYILGIKIKEI